MIPQTFRDYSILLGNVVLIVLANYTASAQLRFYEDLHHLDRQLHALLTMTNCGPQRQRRIRVSDLQKMRHFWWECAAVFAYFTVLVLPLECYLYDYINAQICGMFYAFIITAILVCWLMASIRLAANLVVRRARVIRDVLSCHLLVPSQRIGQNCDACMPTMILAVHALGMLNGVATVRAQFQAGYGGTLSLLHDFMMLFTSFNVYFTIQRVVKNDCALEVLIDVSVFNVPLILFFGWLTMEIHGFGNVVSCVILLLDLETVILDLQLSERTIMSLELM